ncbi:MAG: riboflavin biosynthesis protein RibD [Thermoleophilia bacterium]|nr:riboflavin biosynthesis protein RibD [Thermoleophilia bacterium]
MRKIISTTFMTLDGVMQAPGGPDEDTSDGFAYGGWQAPVSDDEVEAEVMAGMEEPFDLLLGRRTYEVFAAYWPSITDSVIADKFNAATKYVATRSQPDLSWETSVALDGDVAAQLVELKAGDGPNLMVWGSSMLFPTLLSHDLIDELRVMIFPVVLGAGKRLFGAETPPRTLELVSTKTSPKGVTINTYCPAGGVETGKQTA